MGFVYAPMTQRRTDHDDDGRERTMMADDRVGVLTEAVGLPVL